MARKKASQSSRRARQETAARYLPEPLTLESAREAAASCRACELWKTGTQTVFGEGSRRARVMLVGEQPGNREDLEGHPFVGPAGGVLDRALEAAGIDRGKTYVTNVVKHFKWEPRGKVRLHKKPNSRGDRRLPPLARSRDRAGQAARAGGARGDRRPGAPGRRVPCQS